MAADELTTDEDETAQANLKLVRQHYTAFANGDLDGLIETLDPQVVITIRDEYGKAEGEPIRGRDGARSFFEGIEEAVAHSTVGIERLRADENKVLAQISLGGTMRKSGDTGAIPAVHLFTIFDGLITEIRTHRPVWRGYAS